MSNRQSGGESPSSRSACTSSSASVPPSSLPAILSGITSKKHRTHLGKTLQEHVSASPSTFARNQLVKMGWTEGDGLGRRRDGRKSHIVVKRRPESTGLGLEQHQREATAAANGEWWKESLGETLAKLSTSSHSDKKKKKRKQHYTDQELFEATGGARFGMRAAPTKNLAKWRRTDDDLCPPSLHASSVSTTSSDNGDGAITETITTISAALNDAAKDTKRKRDKPRKGKDKGAKKEKKKRKKSKDGNAQA